MNQEGLEAGSAVPESPCECECHRDGRCPAHVKVEVPTPMSSSMVKASYLHLRTLTSLSTSVPILEELPSLLPLLSDHGLFEWTKYVWGNWEAWGVEGDARTRVLQRYLNEIDRRFPVPSSKDEQRRQIQIRDGPGCVCRRDRPACDFQRKSSILLENYEVAHIEPQVLGGRDIWSNLALIRPRCNKSQSGKLFGTWLKEQTGFEWRRTLIWSRAGAKSSNPQDLIAAVGIEWRPDKTKGQQQLPLS